MAFDAADKLKRESLAYHREWPKGKLAIAATKPLDTQHDLALAYSPGVAVACEAIAENPVEASEMTARGNLVAVITNGTAVLGLGNIGPLAAKPVMEGKAVLFKKFAGIDVFDLEVTETDPKRFCDIVAALEPTFGGINLEDIKAPECFQIEQDLRSRMGIPVFHDDQHGTAIIVGAAILNGLRLAGKAPEEVKLVTSGAGAAALASLNVLVGLGLKRENIWVTDIEGVVYRGRESLMDRWKAPYAQETDKRTLAEVIEGADIFLGLSAPNVLKPDYLETMADKPLIMALANPQPEIDPQIVRDLRPDAIMATGRSDFPNQVNNVVCFPFVFRGALDVHATTINEEMKLAAVRAIADLAMAEQSDVAQKAYGGQSASFGPDYIIPRPFDPRLMLVIAPAVAQAAMDSGVATAPLTDMAAYRARLENAVFRTGLVMRPVFEQARGTLRRVAYSEGEDERILQAVQVAIQECLAKPILIGRPSVIETRAKRLGLRFIEGGSYEIVNPESDRRFNRYWRRYHEIMARSGVTPARARTVVRTHNTVIGALAVDLGDADALLAGPQGGFNYHADYLRDVIGYADGCNCYSALSLLSMQKDTIFISDSNLALDPGPEEIVRMTCLASVQVRRFGIEPRIALLSHSSFGSASDGEAKKMREAVRLLHRDFPDLNVDGEMQGDLALNPAARASVLPGCRLEGRANLLIMPNLDAANISATLLRTVGQGIAVGPMLLGTAHPVHVLPHAVTARGIVNMTAVAAADVGEEQAGSASA
ncbi:MAG: NADP-dependent malic enzyme [Rhodospirillales bacterium]|nr:NADP-dependent malic enzyme [Rhodospirillales bacterium]